MAATANDSSKIFKQDLKIWMVAEGHTILQTNSSNFGCEKFPYSDENFNSIELSDIYGMITTTDTDASSKCSTITEKSTRNHEENDQRELNNNGQEIHNAVHNLKNVISNQVEFAKKDRPSEGKISLNWQPKSAENTAEISEIQREVW